jgi:5'-nucleotidase
MKRSFPLFLFLLAAACASVAPPATAPQSGPVHVVFVHTTDVHGWFNGHAETPPGGGEGVIWGGLPTLASYIEVLREQHDNRVIVIDSGDMFQGTLESNLFEGAAVIRGYNRIGYAAAAVGNHEFDYGPLGEDVVARKPGDDPLGALKRNTQLAMFPFLSANMVEKSTGQVPDWARPYTVVTRGGAKVGIIGLSTPDTPNVTMSANVITLSFTDPVAATIKAAQELRAQDVDAIIVIAHMGGRCTKNDDPHDPSSCEDQHEVMKYLAALPPGTIDAYFAGHTHSRMRHVINGVPTLQAGALSREFSTLDLWIDTANNKVAKSELRPQTMICSFVYEGSEECDPRNGAGKKLVPRTYNGQTIKPSARLASALAPYLRQVAAKREQRLGIKVTTPVTRNSAGESPLGNLIADALRAGTQSDIGFMNSGGIRSDLIAGDLVYGDVFAVSPFDNFPAVVRMTGRQIKDFLLATTSGTRGIMQVSGLRYVVDVAKGPDRIVSMTLPSGEPLQLDKTYQVVMPDFVAGGGDGTQDVMRDVGTENVLIYYARPIRDLLAEEWKKQPQPLAPKTDGRITVLNAPAR